MKSYISYTPTILGKARRDNVGDIVVEDGSIVKVVRAAFAGNVQNTAKVTEVASGVAPRADSVALAGETSLGAEGSILAKQLTVVIGIDLKLVVGVADEMAGGVDRLKGVAVVVAQASADCKGGTLLEAVVAVGVDDLSDDVAAVVDYVAVAVAGSGDL